MPLLLLLLLTSQGDSSLGSRVKARIAQAPARAVGVYYRDLATGDSLTVGSGVRFHAASTMKIPVMIQLFRDRDAGLLSLDDSITITNTFRSIVDGSPYLLDVTDDSDSSLYKRVPARFDSRADRADGDGVEQPCDQPADRQSGREARQCDSACPRRRLG